MKKLSTLLIFVLFALVADAQYYYLPYLTANQNPGNVNQDVEQPGTTGYTNIAATNASPAWSTTVFLPGDFTFLFNGNAVTEFKVSTSGVLTFTTSAVTAPTATNAALPSASIPNNSIMVWGLAGSGANDVIRTKMFGDYPNRQQWIQFASYSAPGSAGSNWTYWGIVLEETTNNIYIVDQRTYLTPLTLTLGIQINGSTAYTVTGAPNTPSLVTNGGNADTYEDNIYYKFIPGVQPTNDAELSALTFSNFGGAGANVDITGTVLNVGTAPITSLTVKYLANGLTKTNTITGLNIATNATYDFTHNVPFTIPAPGTWPVKVWVETTGDLNQANDTLTQTISALAFQPTKRIVFEEGTGTWCQWCPRGAVFMDSIHNAYPTTALTIAVHNGDPMTEYYFSSPAFDQYPIVGVSWDAAKYFCLWRSKMMNDYRKKQNMYILPRFELPSESEWEWAARGGRASVKYPWGNPYIANAKGCLMANFKPHRGNYDADGYSYTAPANAYDPNDFGLYNMAGNVAEWCEDAYADNSVAITWDLNTVNKDADEPRKVTRGGSWKDIAYYLETGTRAYELQTRKRSFIGFRCSMRYLGRPNMK